ncbi:MAG TPA: rod shape-determining protein MreD [Fermentimonas sp.]|nr:rod shape-determining protein MreD [Fermentimonas sp.]
MKIRYIQEVFIFILLILLQVLLLNRINVFGYASPVLYIYFILKLPFGRSLFFTIISGFLIGLIIDVFLNTPGMNAAATTIVATFRKPILNLFYDREIFDEFVPGMNTGASQFVKLTVFTVLLHLTLLFFIESFTLFNAVDTFFRVLASSVISILIIISMDGLIYRKKSSD